MGVAAFKTCHFIVVSIFYFLRVRLKLTCGTNSSFILGKATLQDELSSFPLFLGKKNLMQRSYSGTDVSNRAALFSEINWVHLSGNSCLQH